MRPDSIISSAVSQIFQTVLVSMLRIWPVCLLPEGCSSSCVLQCPKSTHRHAGDKRDCICKQRRVVSVGPTCPTVPLATLQMQLPTTIESLDASQPSYLSAAAEVAHSLRDHRCAILSLDDQNGLMMTTVQAVMSKVSGSFTASDETVDQQLTSKHLSGCFEYVPRQNVTFVPGSDSHLISQV